MRVAVIDARVITCRRVHWLRIDSEVLIVITAVVVGITSIRSGGIGRARVGVVRVTTCRHCRACSHQHWIAGLVTYDSVGARRQG